MNDDFGLGPLPIDEGEMGEKKVTKRVSKASTVEPETPAKKYTIIIDEAEGQGESEVIGVNGVYTQIKRGEPVTVGPEILEVLRNAVGTKYVKVVYPDGRESLEPRNFSTIPWRLVT